MDILSILLNFLLVFLAVLVVLYNISTTAHYYIRISFFYFSILVHGCECCITMIPFWFQGGRGADYVINSFYYWCKWSGVQTTVTGFEHTRIDGPMVAICNHQSALDILTMSSCWPKNCAVMMKRVLAYIPGFNLGAYLSNSIFIDRFNKANAMHSVDKCVEEMKSKKMKVWIFPEGTRNREGGLKPFKKGAFNIAVRAQLPILPIVFSDYRPFYSKTEKYFKSDGEVVIEVLPPISTEGLTLEDVPDLTEKVRSQMLEVYERISKEARNSMEAKRAKKLQ